MKVVTTAAGTLRVSAATCREVQELLALIRFKSGIKRTNEIAEALSYILTSSADHAYNGEFIFLNMPDDIREKKKFILEEFINRFGIGSLEYQQAEQVVNRLLNTGIEHGEKIKQFEFLRDGMN